MGLALIVVGVIILLFAAYDLLGTNITAAHHQTSLKQQFDRALHHHTASPKPSKTPVTPTSKPASTQSSSADPSVPVGGAIDHLVIPAIGVNRYVVQGTGEAQLQQGPGHYVGTPLPGQVGNVAIAGHRTTFGAPFFELNELKPGDVIELTDLQDRTWIYRVASQETVLPTDVGVIGPTKTARLTLTTCTPRYWATDRLVVVAFLVGKATVASTPTTGNTHTATKSDGSKTPAIGVLPGDGSTHAAGVTQLGGGNSKAWPATIFYGALVVLGWILVRIMVALTRRWTRAAVLAGGIVACAVPLWFTFENVVRLLPANM